MEPILEHEVLDLDEDTPTQTGGTQTQKKDNKRSEVWKHFSEYTENSKKRSKCNYCGATYAADGKNGTSTMKTHMNKCKANPFKVSDSYTIDAFTQNINMNDLSTQNIPPSKFDQEKVRNALTKMIIIDDPTRPSQDNLSSQSFVSEMGGIGSSNKKSELRKIREEEYRRELIRDEGDCESHSELDVYLSDKKEKLDADFDILMWWKYNSFRYPILSKLARDLLAMPVSTVASESTFSTSGRVIDPFRSSLTPRTVQALICAQDWIRHGPPPPPIEEEFAELLKIETDAMASVECLEPVINGI